MPDPCFSDTCGVSLFPLLCKCPPQWSLPPLIQAAAPVGPFFPDRHKRRGLQMDLSVSGFSLATSAMVWLTVMRRRCRKDRRSGRDRARARSRMCSCPFTHTSANNQLSFGDVTMLRVDDFGAAAAGGGDVVPWWTRVGKHVQAALRPEDSYERGEPIFSFPPPPPGGKKLETGLQGGRYGITSSRVH